MTIKRAAVATVLTALCVTACGSTGASGVIAPAATTTFSTATPEPVAVVTPAAPAATPAVTAPVETPAYTPPTAPAYTPSPAAPPGDGTYTNVDGKTIPDPVSAAAPPAGATARCNDGTYSFSQHHSGTCSGH